MKLKGVKDLSNRSANIAIVESSQIVYEGLSNILLKSNQHYQLFRFDSIDEINATPIDSKFDVIIVNPALIQFNPKDCNTLKRINNSVHWIALVYSFFGKDILSQFNDVIQISDSSESINKSISNIINSTIIELETVQKEQLSERETDVLLQLVHGLSNKEIADKLNISIHTVMSHRKNITQKTGIKSQSGLTIYAISNKIIMLDSLAL
ncbi:MAG: response regulator transcription factor [Tenuifilaceae bacterium]